jgi:hypothetical protein
MAGRSFPKENIMPDYGLAILWIGSVLVAILLTWFYVRKISLGSPRTLGSLPDGEYDCVGKPAVFGTGWGTLYLYWVMDRKTNAYWAVRHSDALPQSFEMKKGAMHSLSSA